MKKLNTYLVLAMLPLLTCSINAQSNFNILNAKTPTGIGEMPLERQKANENDPLSYDYIDDRDILWSTIVWEQIDLNEKINLPLYYPIDSTHVESSRKSLFYTLLRGIKNGSIKEVYDDSFFKSKLTPKDINQKLRRIDTSEYAYEKLNEGVTDINNYIDEISIKSEDIDGYQIKGMWFFDKRQGELRYRILAIAPMGPDVQIFGRDFIDAEESLPLFWIYYPDARKILHKGTAFNQKNPRSPISFDQIFNARRFSSYIIREENLYGNRSIADYVRENSLLQVVESERIKERIRNKELDMWNY